MTNIDDKDLFQTIVLFPKKLNPNKFLNITFTLLPTMA